MKRSFFIISIFICLQSFGQDFHTQVNSIFNFTPHKLTSKEQDAIYPKLDEFFNFVIKNKDQYIDKLRNELIRKDNNPYFYFDGGLLLMEISQSEMDLQLVADALVKADLKDIPSKVYLEHILDLSLRGANVVDAALHILDDPTFEVYIPEHSLTLKYGDALKFVLPRYSSENYINKLITKFNYIKSIENKLTCIDLFVYANCCEADKFLNSLNSVVLQDPKLAEKVNGVLIDIDVLQMKNDKEYNKYFEQRKKILVSINDEILNELDVVSMKMRKEYKCDK